MMYVLAWTVVSWKCPALLGLAPLAVKPLLCQPDLRPQVYVTTDPQGVQEKLEELGQGVPVSLESVTWDDEGKYRRKRLEPKWRAYIDG